MSEHAFETLSAEFDAKFPANGPLHYPFLRELIADSLVFGKENFGWSGAEIEVRIDPAFYRSLDEAGRAALGIPEDLDYEVGIWKPFDLSVWRFAEEVGARDAILETLLWGASFRDSPAARRRHRQRDRLEGIRLGFQFFPESARASVFLAGDRDFRVVVGSAIAPYLNDSSAV